MPANLTPEYKEAEAAFRAAREPRERLECLREMLRTIPKHKGTDHLQADIKGRIKELTDELVAAPARRHPHRPAHRDPPGGSRPDRPARPAQLGQVVPAPRPDPVARRRRPLPLHHPVPPAGHAPFRGRRLPADRPPPAHRRAPGALAGQRPPAGRRGHAGGRPHRPRLASTRCCACTSCSAARRVHLVPTWPRGLPPPAGRRERPLRHRPAHRAGGGQGRPAGRSRRGAGGLPRTHRPRLPGAGGLRPHRRGAGGRRAPGSSTSWGWSGCTPRSPTAPPT